MMRWKLESQQKKLDELFLMVKNIKEEETQSHLAKYLCIRTSGFLEVAFKNLILEYITGTSHIEIQNYVNHLIKNITNLKEEKITKTLSLFSHEWSTRFKALISDQQISSLNSLISNRNNIAHGENDTLTFNSIEKYYEDTKEVVTILKGIIKKGKK